MSKLNLTAAAKSIKGVLERHAPEILTGIGVAGMVTSTVLAVKATPKAYRLVNDRKDELEVEKLPVTELVKTTWKCYIPAVVTCGASIACLVGASSVNFKRNAVLLRIWRKTCTVYMDHFRWKAKVE